MKKTIIYAFLVVIQMLAYAACREDNEDTIGAQAPALNISGVYVDSKSSSNYLLLTVDGKCIFKRERRLNGKIIETVIKYGKYAMSSPPYIFITFDDKFLSGVVYENAMELSDGFSTYIFVKR